MSSFSYQDIVPYTSSGSYHVNVSLDEFEDFITRYVTKYGCDLNPDFQRPLVWTEEQQIRYVEHVLKGGQTGKDLYFNCPGWNRGEVEKNFVLVDGKQRINALLRFLRNEIPVFGHFRSEISGHIRSHFGVVVHVNDLSSRLAVLQWYLDSNSGGTVHSEEELERVRALMFEHVKSLAAKAEEK